MPHKSRAKHATCRSSHPKPLVTKAFFEPLEAISERRRSSGQENAEALSPNSGRVVTYIWLRLRSRHGCEQALCVIPVLGQLRETLREPHERAARTPSAELVRRASDSAQFVLGRALDDSPQEWQI